MLPEHQAKLHEQRSAYQNVQTKGDVERSAVHAGTHVNTHEHHHIHETSEYIVLPSICKLLTMTQSNPLSSVRPSNLPSSTTPRPSTRRSTRLQSFTRLPPSQPSPWPSSPSKEPRAVLYRTLTRVTTTSSVSRRHLSIMHLADSS
jgi:hypothetical protein